MPEALLWSYVRSSQLGFKIRRQHPIGPYVADFFIRERNLVVEIDGCEHDFGDRPERDDLRDRYMNERGIRVLRIPAVEVMKNLDGVLKLIAAEVVSPLHQPSAGPPPHSGED